MMRQFDAMRRWYSARMLEVATEGLKSEAAAKSVTARLSREAAKRFPVTGIAKATKREANSLDLKHGKMFATGVSQVLGERVVEDSILFDVGFQPAAVIIPPKGITAELLKWTAETTGFITGVRDAVIPALRRDLIRAIQTGMSADDLAARWIKQKIPITRGTLEGRAKTIARTQVSQLNARLTKMRAEAIGVTEFRWVTRGDSKVRTLHRQLGARGAGPYSYDNPATRGEGLPGEPFNCRCHAESVIDAKAILASGTVVVSPKGRKVA